MTANPYLASAYFGQKVVPPIIHKWDIDSSRVPKHALAALGFDGAIRKAPKMLKASHALTHNPLRLTMVSA